MANRPASQPSDYLRGGLEGANREPRETPALLEPLQLAGDLVHRSGQDVRALQHVLHRGQELVGDHPARLVQVTANSPFGVVGDLDVLDQRAERRATAEGVAARFERRNRVVDVSTRPPGLVEVAIGLLAGSTAREAEELRLGVSADGRLDGRTEDVGGADEISGRDEPGVGGLDEGRVECDLLPRGSREIPGVDQDVVGEPAPRADCPPVQRLGANPSKGDQERRQRTLRIGTSAPLRDHPPDETPAVPGDRLGKFEGNAPPPDGHERSRDLRP